jgi:SHS2 domain-containing protein
MQDDNARSDASYRFFEERYTADVGFEAFAPTPEKLMTVAAEATVSVMVRDPEGIAFRETVHVDIRSESLEMLLFDFLQELVFYKDAHQLLLLAPEVRIEEADEGYRLQCRACGERLDPERHELLGDVKAVTLHEFGVERTEQGWRAVVVLDI